MGPGRIYIVMGGKQPYVPCKHMYHLCLLVLHADKDEDKFIHNNSWSHASLRKLLSNNPMVYIVLGGRSEGISLFPNNTQRLLFRQHCIHFEIHNIIFLQYILCYGAAH